MNKIKFNSHIFKEIVEDIFEKKAYQALHEKCNGVELWFEDHEKNLKSYQLILNKLLKRFNVDMSRSFCGHIKTINDATYFIIKITTLQEKEDEIPFIHS